MTADPTLDTVALREALERGYTCQSCIWWEKVLGEAQCRQGQQEFPGLCWRFELVEHIGADGERA